MIETMAIDERGYIIYPAFGRTRRRRAEDVLEASDLLERLGKFWGEE